MAYKLKQENYLKRPSAEMKRLFREGWRNEVLLPATRIETSLKIKEVLADPVNGAERKMQLKQWRMRREEARQQRREANSNA